MCILPCINCEADSEQPNISMLCSMREKSAFYPICPWQQPLVPVLPCWQYSGYGNPLALGLWEALAADSLPGSSQSLYCSAPREYLLRLLIGKACSFPLQWEFAWCQVGECWLVVIWLLKPSLIQNSWVKYITATFSYSDHWTISQTSTSDTIGIFPWNSFLKW